VKRPEEIKTALPQKYKILRLAENLVEKHWDGKQLGL